MSFLHSFRDTELTTFVKKNSFGGATQKRKIINSLANPIGRLRNADPCTAILRSTSAATRYSSAKSVAHRGGFVRCSERRTSHMTKATQDETKRAAREGHSRLHRLQQGANLSASQGERNSAGEAPLHLRRNKPCVPRCACHRPRAETRIAPKIALPEVKVTFRLPNYGNDPSDQRVPIGQAINALGAMLFGSIEQDREGEGTLTLEVAKECVEQRHTVHDWVAAETRDYSFVW